MTITIKLKTDNAAFHPPDGDREQEIQQILERWIADGFGPRTLRDSNGNTVGSVKVTGR